MEAEAEFRGFLSTLAKILSPGGAPAPIKSLLVEGYDSAWLQCKAWTTTTSTSLEFERARPRLSLGFRESLTPRHHFNWDNVLHKLFSATLFLDNLEFLSLKLGDCVLTSQTILSCFGRLFKLHTIEITDNFPHDLVLGLRNCSSSSDPPPLSLHSTSQQTSNAPIELTKQGVISFPGLRVLRLNNIPIELSAPFFIQLVTSLLVRMERNVAIDKVELYECGGMETSVYGTGPPGPSSPIGTVINIAKVSTGIFREGPNDV
ncbi:hypothetical protein PQX77_012300 [Marasmius sp. AFHP31]|nr:hypothetical protein PQX77_012300 [Marasmius sp. AFHP31]